MTEATRFDDRQTRMLHALGLTWLPVAGAPSDLAARRPPASLERPDPLHLKRNSPSVAGFIESVAIKTEAIAARQSPQARAAAVPAVVQTAPQPIAVQRADLAQADWPALRESVTVCQACGLCKTRRNTVVGQGSQQASVLVLGEAPGENEDAQALPFVGEAGQLLDNMLAAIQWSREDPADGKTPVYLTNTLKCRPPGNRNPELDELAQCAPFLQRQVQLLQPKLILALGKFAVLQTLGVQDPIGKLRGRVHHANIGGHACQVVVSYDPSYLIREFSSKAADRARAWEDLVLAADTLESQRKVNNNDKENP